MSIAPLERDGELLSERAYDAIRRLIVTLELAPGSVVSESELVERLGIGRTPVREALRVLATEALVEVYPRRGMFVAGVDARDLASLSEARAELEPLAARLAANRVSRGDIAEIDVLLAELDALGPEVDQRELMALDERLHTFVYRCSRNRFVENSLREFFSHALRIWFLAVERVEHLDDAVQEHREILEAIRDGDGDRAAAVMSEHIRAFESAIRRAL